MLIIRCNADMQWSVLHPFLTRSIHKRIMFSKKLDLLCILAVVAVLQVKSQVRTDLTIQQAPVKVTVKQDLKFGTFTQGASGGSITLLPEGTRLAGGTVIPLNFGGTYMPLLLEIEGPKGSIVSIVADDRTILTGSNGGMMKLKLGNSIPSMPFIILEDAPAKSIVKIGAELIVGNLIESPPGNYSGSLNISFVVE
jgi:hypothetical protein